MSVDAMVNGPKTQNPDIREAACMQLENEAHKALRCLAAQRLESSGSTAGRMERRTGGQVIHPGGK